MTSLIRLKNISWKYLWLFKNVPQKWFRADKIDMGPLKTLKKWNAVFWKQCIAINQSVLSMSRLMYKIELNTTLQPSIKILTKCSCVSEDTKWVSSLLQFVAIWSSYSLKRVFLRKSRDAPLCFPEPWFGFPTLIRTHVTTQACNYFLKKGDCGTGVFLRILRNTYFAKGFK